MRRDSKVLFLEIRVIDFRCLEYSPSASAEQRTFHVGNYYLHICLLICYFVYLFILVEVRAGHMGLAVLLLRSIDYSRPK